MKALIEVKATAEQLALFARIQPGVEVIRGAAGSGKTTTALLKLRAAVGMYINRKRRMVGARPVRVLILTFNRTLRGYVAELAERQFAQGDDVTLEIDTFSRWASRMLGNPPIIDTGDAANVIKKFGRGLALSPDFVVEETRYVLEKFLPTQLDQYLTARRDGRGTKPRMEQAARAALMNDVIIPYTSYKATSHQCDFSDLAVQLANSRVAEYDIVVVDEAQDFSANELRAVVAQMSKDSTSTFVLDTTQRIYSRVFTWQEVGLVVRPENSHKLTINYRNTKEIAKFAASILGGMSFDDNGSMPDFNSATRSGPKPKVLTGKFSGQLAHAIKFIKENVDLGSESVAFLHAKGGRWFDSVKEGLDHASLPFVSIARQADWPQGSENIALSTLHSAKGLEFDHIFILGLNAEVVPDGSDADGDDEERANAVRRLVAMGVGRARLTASVGYKPSDAPAVAKFFDASTCKVVIV